MKLRLEPHALQRARERGATEAEIRDTVLNGLPIVARPGRQGRAKVFAFEADWNGRRYPEKRVEVFFMEEDGTKVIITVYVFYGKWSEL